MKRVEAISNLKRHANAIRAMGATSLYLFGSVAQDEVERNSDLDLFVDYDPNSRFNAFDLVGIKQLLVTELEWMWTSRPASACTRCCAMSSSGRQSASSDVA